MILDTPVPLFMRSDAGDFDVPVGTVSFDATGRISVTEARPGFDLPLERITSAVNEMDEITVQVAPPAGAEQHTIVAQTFTRDDADIARAVHLLLQQKYGMRAQF